jgi:arginine:ornithine antiporter/lysine permease
VPKTPGAETTVLERAAEVKAAPGGTLSLGALIALVVGSMIGGGIFSLPQGFARQSGALGAVIAWCIAGAGMLMLALVFQTLSRRRPDLDAGVYAYAQAGFGNYLGFLSALGYWASACLGNVSFLLLSQSTLGGFFPAFGEGNTPLAAAVASMILWAFHAMLLRGVRSATAINTVVTIAKIVPIVVFVVLAAACLHGTTFAANFWGTDVVSISSVFAQVRGLMLITVFVFIGIEGASVYSRYARRRADVGRATVLGFLGVLGLFVLVTLLSYGILQRSSLATLRNPSMAGVLDAIVGHWGAVFVSLGVLISVLGAFLSWSLLAAEVLFNAARTGTMPAFLGRENGAGSPAAALWLTSLAVQGFLIVTQFGESALRLAMELTSAMSLIPYLLVAAYGLQLAWRGETYAAAPQARRNDAIRGMLATLYAMFLIVAGGLKFVLLSAVFFAPGSVLFVMARRERGHTVFTITEAALAGIVCAAAVAAVAGIASGVLGL